LARQQPGNVEESMDRIERESVRMDHLIDELLTLSRVGAGVDAEQQESVDIAELLIQVVQDVSFEQRGVSAPVTFESRIEDLAVTRVKGNAEMLHRVFENVVRNAARHTPPGTRISIVAGHDPVRREVRVLISDEGPGVPVADLESIFEPFFRGATGRGASGHGLGLTIARRIIEAHGGSIGASNRTTGGLSVEIRLPV
jgi:two-component system OmpR family sensor kinase